MKNGGADHNDIPNLYIICLIAADNLIGSVLGYYYLYVRMPVRRKIGMKSIVEYPEIGIDLMINFFFGVSV